MGELFISARDARKRFTQFLRTETRCLGSDEPYSAQLMRQKGQNRVLDVDLQDVKNYDDVLGQLLEEQPNTYLPVVRHRPMPSAACVGLPGIRHNCSYVCSLKKQRF